VIDVKYDSTSNKSYFRNGTMSEQNIQQTFIILKPDALVKSVSGNIITRLSETHLRIIASRVVKVSRELAETHYAHLKEKPFFNDLYDYFSGKIYGPEYERVIAFVYEGDDAVGRVRRIAGATNPNEADPISIRGAYGRINKNGVMENLIHCSDSVESAEKEIKLWMQPDDLIHDIYPTRTITAEGKTFRVWK
jgi:nucleoside-diphosphate kinase